MENEDVKVDIDVVQSVGEDGAVIVDPRPVDEEVQEAPAIVQNEVSYKDFVQKELNLKDGENVDHMSEVMALEGQSMEAAKEVLEELMKAKAIREFSFIPMGALTTADFVPGRVRLYVDGEKNVLEVEVG